MRADELAPRRTELRARLGVPAGEVVVLSVGRLVPEKGFDTLVAAAAPDLRIVIAGGGPLRAELERRGATLVGEVDEETLAELYAAADVFALLSTHEPWGVVVNEAAASALPLVLSDEVGAARDLLRPGENGLLVAPGDPAAAAGAIRHYLDPDERRRAGARSRELVRGWGYDASVDAFVAAVGDATASR
jgi:glycosyltransferase involved in cell wall biosynthesis